MRMRGKLAICAFAGLGLALPGLSQDMRTASENVVACQTVSDPAERLVCFETAAAELSALLVTPSVAATDAPIQQAESAASDAEEAPRSRLPSWIPRVTFGGDRDVEKEPDEFETQVTRIQVNRLGRYFVTTAEGHVWRQKSPEEIRAPKKLPADVIIYQNITGGLRLKIVETNRSYAVRRVE